MKRVISAPTGLKWAAAAVFLTVPIAAAQVAVIARAPWWALPVKSMETAAIWAFGASILSTAMIVRGRRLLYAFLCAFGFGWVFLSGFTAIKTHNPDLGFFAIFLGVYFGFITSWVKHELARSFFDPKMNWFEGAPRAIPALDCEIASGSAPALFKVSRLDAEGAFLFIPGRRSLLKKFPLESQSTELCFRFRGLEVRCQAVPMLLFKRNSVGVGFRFKGNSPDQKKQLGDFIETLRGEGYV